MSLIYLVLSYQLWNMYHETTNNKNKKTSIPWYKNFCCCFK